MFPLTGRLAIAVCVLASSAASGTTLLVQGVVNQINGPNVEGIALGVPLTVLLDFELVTTPYDGWDPEAESLEDAVAHHAATTSTGSELDMSQIHNAASPAYWVLHGLFVDTPYGVWDPIWRDYTFLLFDDNLDWNGFYIGGSSFSVTIDPRFGLSEWWMGPEFSEFPAVQGPITYAGVETLLTEPFAMRLVASPVPEPSTFALAAGAMLALGLLRKHNA